MLRFGPVYNLEFLKEVFQFQEKILTIGQNESVGLDHICFAAMTFEGQKPTLKQCVVQSIFGFFQNSLDELLISYVDINGFQQNHLNKIEKCFS